MTINCMLSHQYYWTLGYAWSVQGWTNTLMLFYTITFLATSFLSYYFGSQSLSHSSDFRKPIPTPFSLSFFFSCYFSIPVQVQSLILFVFCNSHVCNCSPHLLLLLPLRFFLLFSPRCIYLILIQLIQRNIRQICLPI